MRPKYRRVVEELPPLRGLQVPICLACARKGRNAACASCASLNPTPRYLIVKDIIEKAGQEHRLAQLAADAQFKADSSKTGDKYKKILDAQARCRKKKRVDLERINRERNNLSEAAHDSLDGK